jgi:hypothetical protein
MFRVGHSVNLPSHRKNQDEFRRQFGPDYRVDLDLISRIPTAPH